MNVADDLVDVLNKMYPCSPQCKVLLDQAVSAVTQPKGYFLVHSDTISSYIYFLEKGCAVSYRYQKDKKIVTGFWKPGDIIISPKSFFSQCRSEELIQLTMNSQLKSLSWEVANDLFDKHQEANIYARIITANYLTRSEQLIADLHHLSAGERYQKLIRTYPGIEGHVSQDLISSYLNITPQSLSRVKKTASLIYRKAK